ncbi:MAG: hypothetical protein ABFS41_15735 [Myxococcota bacterium]
MEASRPTSDQRHRAVLVGVAAFLLFDVVVALLVWRFFADARATDERVAAWTEGSRTVSSRSSAQDVVSSAAGTVWRLGDGLDAVVVHDILPDPAGDGAWLGTGLGLVHVSPDGATEAYRIFPGAPREWARDLARTPEGIAVSITLAEGNTGGETVATFRFDPERKEFERIGPYARELASDGTNLYGVHGRELVQFVEPSGNGGAVVPVTPDVRICNQVDLVHAAGALWMTQQGKVRRGSHGSRTVPCGVTRLEPGGDTYSWMEEDGLASGFGRSVVGDESTVIVSHGIQGDGLSVLELAAGRWQRVRGGSGIRFDANVLGLSPRSIWLGTPDGRRPLVRIDRSSGRAEAVSVVPENHYVSAIGGDDDGAWVAWSAKQYEGTTYHVKTWVARLRDAGTRTARH